MRHSSFGNSSFIPMLPVWWPGLRYPPLSVAALHLMMTAAVAGAAHGALAVWPSTGSPDALLLRRAAVARQPTDPIQ